MYVDMHSHLGGWSPDAAQSVEMLLDAAMEKSLDGIAITDHYEMDSVTSSGKTWTFDIRQYWEQNVPFRKRPSVRSKGEAPGILIGIEIGFLPGHIAEARELMSRGKFDCIILSLHAYEGIDPVTEPEAMYIGNMQENYAKVIHKIGDAAELFPEADIIGHYDFFARYCPEKRSKMLYRHAPEEFDRLFRLMIQNDQALEINTGTVEAMHRQHGYSMEESMPDPEIVERYMELGGTRFTLGSDAHVPGAVARYFSETIKWMRCQGIERYFWMEGRKWHSALL